MKYQGYHQAVPVNFLFIFLLYSMIICVIQAKTNGERKYQFWFEKYSLNSIWTLNGIIWRRFDIKKKEDFYVDEARDWPKPEIQFRLKTFLSLSFLSLFFGHLFFCLEKNHHYSVWLETKNRKKIGLLTGLSLSLYICHDTRHSVIDDDIWFFDLIFFSYLRH